MEPFEEPSLPPELMLSEDDELRPRRHPTWVVAVAVLVVLGMLALGTTLVVQHFPERQEQTPPPVEGPAAVLHAYPQPSVIS